MFEFGTESAAGWLAHSSGIETILRLRGPQMHIAGFDWQMFSFYRTVGVRCWIPPRHRLRWNYTNPLEMIPRSSKLW